MCRNYLHSEVLITTESFIYPLSIADGMNALMTERRDLFYFK